MRADAGWSPPKNFGEDIRLNLKGSARVLIFGIRKPPNKHALKPLNVLRMAPMDDLKRLSEQPPQGRGVYRDFIHPRLSVSSCNATGAEPGRSVQSAAGLTSAEAA